MEVHIIDCFPLDHPALDNDFTDTPDGNGGGGGNIKTPNGGQRMTVVDSKVSRQMITDLDAIVKNKIEGRFGVPKVPQDKGEDSILDKIHGYIYVYDASNKNTFETL